MHLCFAGQSVNEWHVWEESVLIFRISNFSKKFLDIFLGDFISKVGKDVFKFSKHHGSIVVFVIQLEQLNIVMITSGRVRSAHGSIDLLNNIVELGSQSYQSCQRIADADCVCLFGQCVIEGHPFTRGSECEQYTDCDCRSTPETCFCKDGYCKETRWECHEKRDCARLTKCGNKDCSCSGNTCEHDCDIDQDCKDFHCNRALGYTCKCENSLCAYKQKP